MNDNNMLSQKTFSKSAIGQIQDGKTKRINQSLKGRKTLSLKPVKNSISNKSVNTISFEKMVCIFVLIVYVIADYFILLRIGFEAENTFDYIELVVMVLSGSASGVGMYYSQFKGLDGYILRYLIAFLYGIIRNLMGLGISFVICLILSVVVSVGGWFFG